MKRLLAIFALLFATSALAVDNVQSCTGASCVVRLQPRDASANKATAVTATPTTTTIFTQATSSTSNPELVVDRGDGAVKAVIGYNDVATDMYLGTLTNHTLEIRTNNTTKMTVLSGGNVGIGTVNPTAALDVAGNIQMSGAFTSTTKPVSVGVRSVSTSCVFDLSTVLPTGAVGMVYAYQGQGVVSVPYSMVSIFMSDALGHFMHRDILASDAPGNNNGNISWSGTTITVSTGGSSNCIIAYQRIL